MNDGQDNLRNLYKTLRDNGYNPPAFEQFAKDMEDEKNLRGVYSTLQKEGYTPPAFDQFKSDMGFGMKPVATQTPTTEPSSTTSVDEGNTGKQDNTWQPSRQFNMEIDRIGQQVQKTEQDFSQRMERMRRNGPFGGGKGVEYNPATGKMEDKYYTLTGEAVATPMEQHRIDSEALAKAEASEDVQRFKEERLPQIESFAREAGARRARQRSYDDDMANAASAAWDAAEKQYNIDAANAAANVRQTITPVVVGNPEDRAFAEATHIVRSSMVADLKNHDMKRMADAAWNSLGKEKQDEIIEDTYTDLKLQYPNADENQLREFAAQIAREQNDIKMYNIAVEKNAPASALDFFAQKVVGMQAWMKLLEAGARAEAGTTGDWEAREAAMQQYEQNGHRWLGIGGTVAGMAIDPTTWIAAGAGGAATKGSMWLSGKLLFQKGGEAAVREFAPTLAGRVLFGAVGGAANIGTYEATNEALEQAKWGGHRNEETGEIEDYSVGAIFGKMGHGALMGTATGIMSPLVGNVSDKVVKATSSTTGKLAVRTGELGVSTLAEGTIFSIPEWIEGDRDAFDVWTDNMAMMAGFKAQHIVKSAPRRIRELSKQPNSKAGFETRLRNTLDRGRGDLALTADERDELQRGGYGDLKTLVEEYEEWNKNNAATGERIPGQRLIGAGEGTELPYNRFIELMNDGSISEAARAKMYYYISGQQLPMSTVMGSSVIDDKKGGYYVRSYGANGVITSRHFDSKERADVEVERIARQSELNHIDVGERYYDKKHDEDRMREACQKIANEKGMPNNVEALFNLMKRDPESMTPAEVEWAHQIMDVYESLDANAYGSAGLRADINNEFGVNVDKAIKKEPNRRSEQEQLAMQEYAKRLFAGVEQEQPKDETPFERGHEAREEERRDIVMELAEAEQGSDVYAEREEAMRGVKQKIEEDADYQVAQQREVIKNMTDDYGSMRPIVLKEKDENGNDKTVYVVNGDIVMQADGVTIDKDKSTPTIWYFDPTDGQKKSVAPSDILSVGEVKSAEVIDNELQKYREWYVQDQIDKAQGTIKVQPGDKFTMADGSQGTVMATDGENIVVQQADGTQTTMPVADVQRIADELARADYQQRHGIDNTTEAQPQVATQEETTPNGVVAGAPEEFLPNMEITINDDGQEKSAMVMGRVRSENGKFVPDENGALVEYYMDGDVHHEWIAPLKEKVVSHISETPVAETPTTEQQPVQTEQPQQPVSEAPQQVVETPVEQPAAAEETATPSAEAMPMREDGEADFLATTPERGHQYIYNETGLSREEAGQFVKNNIEAATKALDKAKKEPPKMGTSLVKYNQQKAEHQAKVDAAQQAVDYWQGVKAAQSAIVAAELSRQAEADAARHEAAVAQQQADMEAAAAKQAEQEERGAFRPSKDVVDKWTASPKVEGYDSEITLPNGETLEGKYMLVESGTATPSHDGNNNFKSNEGYPVDENGNNINDRDYERSEDARKHTINMAQSYDGRAIKDTPVVTNEGVVISGNGRTIAGELAAQNGTDGVYVDKLKKLGRQYGFTPEQVGAMQHPRLVFVPNETPDYTTETMSKFNGKDEKEMSRAEKALKYGKMIDDDTYTRIIRNINSNNTMSDFYGNDKSVGAVIGDMRGAGIYTDADLPKLRDGNRVSEAAKEDIECAIIGKFFEGNPDMVNMIVDMPLVRQSVVKALQEIAENSGLKDEYTLQQHFADAVKLVYGATKAKSDVAVYAKQFGIDFETGEVNTAADIDNMTVLMLADVLSSKETTSLKKVLAIYNDQARNASNNQGVLFGAVDGGSGVQKQEQILNEVTNFVYHGNQREIGEQLARAAAERQAASMEQADNVEPVSSESVQPAAAEEVTETSEEAEIAEEALSARYEMLENEESEEQGPNGTIYRRPLIIDGEYRVEQVDEPNEKGDYPGSYFMYHGRRFGDLRDVFSAIDNIGEGNPNEKIATAEAQVETNPTDAQKEAGNYKKGHVRFDGYDLTIENKKGSERSGKDADGKEWSVTMQNTYGYIRGTKGVDGDQIDIYLSDTPEQGDVFVVDQVNPKTGEFDEHKVMYGFHDMESAKAAYLSNYEDGWQGLGAITPVSKDEFKKWIDSSKRKTKPFSEYKSVTPLGDVQTSLSFAEPEENKPTEKQNNGDFNTELKKLYADYESGENGYMSARDFIEEVRNLTDLLPADSEVGKRLSDAFAEYDDMQNAYYYENGQRDDDGSDAMIEAIEAVMSGAGKTTTTTEQKFYNNHGEEYEWNEHGICMNTNKQEYKKGRNNYTIETAQTENGWVGSCHANTSMGGIGSGVSKDKYDKFFDTEEACKAYHAKSVLDFFNREGAKDKALINSLLNIIKADKEAVDYAKEVKDEIEAIEAKLDDHNSANNDYLIQQIADIMAEAEDMMENYELTDDLRERFQARHDAAEAWMEANVWGEGESTSKGASITPAKYTTKKGKVLDMHLVKFDKDLTKEQMKAAKEFAKSLRGWWSKDDNGFLMRSKDEAQALIDTMSNPEAVKDEQPVSVFDMATATDNAKLNEIEAADKLAEKPQEGKPQYNYDIEDEARDRRLESLREQFKDNLPSIDAMEANVRDLENRIKISNEMLERDMDDISKSLEYTRLATNTGYLRANQTFLSEVRRRKMDQDRDNALAAHGVKIGDKVMYKGKEATIHDAETRYVVLDTGMAPVLYEQTDWENVEIPTSEKRTEPYKSFDDLLSNTEITVTDPSTISSMQKIVDKFFVHGSSNVKKDNLGVEYNFVYLADYLTKAESKLLEPFVNEGRVEHNDNSKEASWVDEEKQRIYFIKHSENSLPYDIAGYRELSKENDNREADNQTEQDTYGANNQFVSRERYEELKKRMQEKLNRLNSGVDPEMLAIGAEMAVFHIEAGARKFIDFAKKMIADLGDGIRPYLKAFYNAGRDMPEMESRRDEFTPYDEVSRFDVLNFDKDGAKDIIATAEHVVREQETERQAETAKNEIKTTRNEQRKEIEQQTEASTPSVINEAEAVADKAESRIEAAGTEQELNDVIRDIDSQLDKVNEQLALLGYYGADEVEGDFNEAYGYRRNAEKKAVKDADNLARHIAKDLGIDVGRKKLASANIAPAGGDVSFRLPLHEGTELYVDINLEPDGLDARGSYKDGLNVTHAYYRIELPSNSGANRYLSPNRYFGGTLDRPYHYKNAEGNQPTYKDVIDGIREDLRKYLPDFQIKEPAAVETKKDTTKKPRNGKKDVSLQSQTVMDFFGDIKPEEQPKATKKPINNNNNETTDVQSRTREEGRGGHQPQTNGEVGGSAGNETERPVRSGVAGRDTAHPGTDRTGSEGLSELPAGEQRIEEEQPKRNLNNNHAERGKDYAPKDVDKRIEANLAAIEKMQELMESGKQATPKDMAILRKFSGWGGLGKAFQESSYGWQENSVPSRLRKMLGDEAYEQANMSRNSAYYTPANIIDSLWDIARALGFKGGKVLEGSAGIGNIIGLMPQDMSDRSDIHAVEIDNTTGNILKLLYPDAKVDVKGFEATEIENGSVDLSITNVPFVTGLHVNDTTGDKDLSKKFRDIHDFCIAKNVRKLRDGGIGIFITSSGTLDNSTKLREWIGQEGNADVVGAFRMNNETFGGTGATSDIIVIRKRFNGKKSAHAIDVMPTIGVRSVEYDTGETKKVKGEYVPIVKHLSLDYNKYFVEHPEMMGGEMGFAFEHGDTYRATSKALYPKKGINQNERLADFVKSLEGFDNEVVEVSQTEQDNNNIVYEELGADVKEGSMVVSNGKVCVAQRGRAVPLRSNPKTGEKASEDELIERFHKNKVKGHTKAECFEDYKKIKDALNELLAYQTEHDDNDGLQPLLDNLNRVYDSFVKTYGHLHKNNSTSFLKNDVDYPNVLALEKFSERADVNTGEKIQEFGKTDIFTQRVVEKEKAPEPTNVKDGIIASIYVHGRIDMPWIVEKLSHSMEGITEQQVKDEIVKSGLGFENPVTRQMEVSYDYLSGNVREKLAQAQENNADGKYNANISALEAVIPMNIPSHLIDFNIGSSWIEPQLYIDFIKEKTDVNVKLTLAGGTWIMSTPNYVNEQKNRAMGIVSEKCGYTVMGTTLIEAAMTNKTINVSKSYKSNGETVTIQDKEATTACANKVDEIRQEFRDWAREKMQGDAELSERIETIYNDIFNNYVPKSIPDEFVPEHFGGAATVVDGKPFALRPHQGKAVVRGTTQPLLLAHEVGTGKTYTLITTAMEMRRIGTARKPMIVVQNATVGQFVESAKKLYPNAKVLTLEDKDHNEEGRKNFYAKIKYNDWDMIVVPQSVFDRIPDSPERQIAYINDKIEEKMMVLEKMREADESNANNSVIYQAEKEIDKLNEELAAITDSRNDKQKERDEKREAIVKQNTEVMATEMLDRQTDDVEDFDEMGIDALMIDEAHEYKHLGFATAMQRGVKGIDPSYSKKAQGAYLKTQAVMERNNGRNVIFATGTPISNTAAEIWTFMRYLMPADTMRDYGIYYFDDFVRNFGSLTQMLEFTTSGKFKENNRFAGYVNLPELVRIWSGVADTVLTAEAGGVNDKIPAMEGGKAKDIYLPQTKALRSVMKFVKAELERFENMTNKEKKQNSYIPLTMYGIAKAAAVDTRLVVDDVADDPNSKTNEAVRQTLQSLKDTESYKGTVAIFADNYQNKNTGFNLYEDIREKLIAAGVPEKQIVVMKSGMKVNKKLEIFDMVNRGDVRVIMGSTFTLGTGVNIQERLNTLIHLDAPNRPMDYTQRNGRILRQGNLHKEMGIPVRVLRFGVEDSLDVTAYQRLKTKGAIADSIMNGKQLMNNSMENRVMEEEEDVFGDTIAQLSGSEYAMLKNQAEKEVRKYEAKKKQWEADQTYCHSEIPRLESSIRHAKARLEDAKKALAKVEEMAEKQPTATITVEGKTFSNIDAMADVIKEFNKKIREVEGEMRDDPYKETSRQLSLKVNVGGFDFDFNTHLNIETSYNNQGTLFSAVHRKMYYSCDALGLEDIPVYQSLLREGIEDIVNNVITGNDFRERIENATKSIAKNENSLEQVKARNGKPFEFTKELEEAKNRLKEYAELMKAELEAKEAKYAEMDEGVEAATDVHAADEEEENETDNAEYRLREDVPPTKTGIGYKVFVVKDGKLYPPMVANPNGEATPVGVWLDADAAPVVGESKTGRPQVKAGGKGTQGGSGTLAYRPGWHLGEIPYALQFNRLNPETGERELFPANFVWAEVEYANDVDYNDEARAAGTNANGKYQHSLAGLKHVPENGSYMYRTNPDPNTDPWIITGAMKVKRLLKPSEVDAIVEAAGREPQARQAGALTDEQVEAMNKAIERKMRNDADLKRNAVEQMGAKFYTPIRIVEDVEEINHNNADIQKRRRNAKGWYDPVNNEVVVVLPNNKSVDEAEATAMHETIAHKGLRELVGEENYNTFLDEVYSHLKDDIKKRVDTDATRMFADGNFKRSHDDCRRQAVNEMFGRLAEKSFEDFNGGERTLWQKLCHLVRRLLDKFLGSLKLPSWFTIGDNEMRYMLWRSKENLERGKENYVDLARDANMRNELRLNDDVEYSGKYRARKKTKAEMEVEKIDKEENGQLYHTAMKLQEDYIMETGVMPLEMCVFTEKHLVIVNNIEQGNISAVRAFLIERDKKEIKNELTDYINNEGDEISESTRSVIEEARVKHGISVDYTGNTGERKTGVSNAGVGERHETERGTDNTLDSGAHVESDNFEYRDGETDDIWSDQSMGMKEKITAAATRLSENHSDDKRLRSDAMRAISDNLTDLIKAMSLQREYDRSTVKRVADLARVLIGSKNIDDLSRTEVMRLLSAVKNATGKEDITNSVKKVMDILIDNQLRRAEDNLRAIESIKASKVDARGVEVQGQLDVTGQQIMRTFKETRGWSEKELEEAISEQMNRMGSNDVAVAEQAANEYAGLQFALEYVQNIKASKVEERELRLELESIKPEWNNFGNGQFANRDAYLDFKGNIENAIRENHADRVEAYAQLIGKLTGSLRESIANAIAFKEAEKERVREIQHNANSDMEGRPSDEHGKADNLMKSLNNVAANTLFAPLGTFVEMMRLFGSKSSNGEGYLFNRFVRGLIDARQKEIRGVRSKYDILDAKVREIFGDEYKNMAKLISKTGKMDKLLVEFWDGGEMKQHKLTQGNMMYIYMVNKMLDGRIKLRKMGIDENAMRTIMQTLDQRLIDLADWMQGEFLVDTRNEYNETHKRMFGASMAAIEDYFPLKILANARADNPEELDAPDYGKGISTKTGSIIKRRRNALALDITRADALNVILDHVAQMEHWNAFAEYNRDLNTLRTYKRFRNQVQNMTTIYGNGKKLWDNFNDVCQMAVGSYRPKQGKLDRGAIEVARGVTAAKVSFRINTALKQLLSMPAYLPYINASGFFGSIANNLHEHNTSFAWCMKNLPLFEERWKSRVSGDPKLAKSVMDWQSGRANWVQKIARGGMLPNAFVDALTVSIGAHAVYETRKAQYLKAGYDEEKAEKRAIQDAEIAYNETQQSSEGGFTSTMQADHTWLSTMFSVFRNASMSYTRRLADAIRNIGNNITPSQRNATVEFETKKMVRDGVDENKAEKAAKRKLHRDMRKNWIAIATFGAIVQFAWNFGGKMWYLLFGDDDDEKSKMWDDIFAQTIFGSVEGLTGGDVMSEFGRQWVTGDWNPKALDKDMPLSSDVTTLIQKACQGKGGDAINDMVNLIVQAGLGMNPQSITDIALAIIDACGDDPALAHEATIFVSRVLQVPQSQIDKMYFDEVGLSGEEISKYTPEQLARRYAEYKVKRGHFITPWNWGDEELIAKQEKKADKAIKERTERLGDEKVNESYLKYEEIYNGVDKKVKAANAAKKTGYVEFAQKISEAQSDRRAYTTYSAFKNMEKGLNKLVELYLGAKSSEEAALCHQAIIDYKAAMVEMLDNEEDNGEITAVTQPFMEKYKALQDK